jgi:hypothetical protein
MFSTLLIVVLVLALISAVRTRIYSIGAEEYQPNKELGIAVAVIIILAFTAGFVDL